MATGPEMQCQGCKAWFHVTEFTVNVPRHVTKKQGRDRPCPGQRRPPFATRGFTSPPPSITS